MSDLDRTVLYINVIGKYCSVYRGLTLPSSDNFCWVLNNLPSLVNHNPSLTSLYHLTVQDASEAAQTKMMEKIDKTSMPEGFKNAAKRIGAKAASKLATPSAVAAKMSEKIPKKIPEEMAQKGMTAEVESVFLEGVLIIVVILEVGVLIFWCMDYCKKYIFK